MIVEETRDPRGKLPSAASNLTVFGLAYKLALGLFPELDPMYLSAIAAIVQQVAAATGHALRDAKFFSKDKHQEGSLRDVLSTLGANLLG
jgi:hypothetical protein